MFCPKGVRYRLASDATLVLLVSKKGKENQHQEGVPSKKTPMCQKRGFPPPIVVFMLVSLSLPKRAATKAISTPICVGHQRSSG